MISSLFGIAVAALLYIVYLQVKEAGHIELPTGRMDSNKTNVRAGLSATSREVLVINSYHAGHAWSDNEMAGIIGIFKEHSHEVRYGVEYLDCKHHPKTEHFELVKDLFSLKYGSRDIPVVVAADNPAFEFALKYRALLFPRSAIVFCGVNNYKKEMLGGQGNITGLAEALDADDTVRTALKIHPETREIFVVHDYTSTGLATRREAEEQLRGLFDQISFRYVEDMTKKELTQLLKGLPEYSLVLALAYNVFRDGEVIKHEDLARLLSENSPVPVYGVHQERLGYGIVGGSLLSGRLHGEQAARVALKILSGTPASNVPVEMKPRTQMMFDYNQLVRFRIPVKALPEGSIIVNRPVSFISLNLYLFVSTLLVIIILTSGIIILGSNVYQRRLAEEALLKSKEGLEMRVTERTAELQSANEQLQVELTERRRAQELLEAGERRLAEAQRMAHVGSWELDLLKNELTWSDEIYRIFEIDAGRFGASYEAFLSAIHPDDRQAVDAAYINSVKNRTPYTIEHRLLLPDGRVKFVREECETYYDQDGAPLRSLGTVQDITERRKTEEELRVAVMYNRSLIEASLDPLVTIGPDGKITDVNAATEKVTGRTRSELIGTDFSDYFTEPEEARAGYKKVFKEGFVLDYPLELQHRDGSVTSVLYNASVYRNESGQIAGVFAAARDITDRKKADREIRRLNEELEQRVLSRTADLEKKGLELKDSQLALMNIVEDLNLKTEELERANIKLKELDRLKSMFIASMSHELRTPLNSIIGFSSILMNEWAGPVTPEQKENLASILRSGKHLLSLVNDVIDVSKIEAGKIESVTEDFDIYDVVSEAAASFTKDIREKGLDMNVQSVHQVIQTDRRRLLQCLLNLISNAVKFTGQGAISVCARTAADGKNIEIEIADTGIGMREDDIQKLFSAFVRLDSPLRATVPGTGLGLYLTNKLLREVMKGDIMVKSTYGKGSCFTLIVPVAGPVRA